MAVDWKLRGLQVVVAIVFTSCNIGLNFYNSWLLHAAKKEVNGTHVDQYEPGRRASGRAASRNLPRVRRVGRPITPAVLRAQGWAAFHVPRLLHHVAHARVGAGQPHHHLVPAAGDGLPELQAVLALQ
eukprot:4320235-Prymnesium_polylepis.1